MARAPATIPTITSHNASAATFRCRRITRTSPAKSTLVPFPDAECTRGVGGAGTISARIRKPAERVQGSRTACQFLLKLSAIVFLRWHSRFQRHTSMWIVRLALRRPYTFVVMALLISVLGVGAIVTMTVDIFPAINIPVVTVIWNYSGLSPTEMQNRIVTITERAFTTTVNGIEHIESVSLRGVAISRLYFHPNVPIEAAIAQVNAQAQQIVRVLPPGIFPPAGTAKIGTREYDIATNSSPELLNDLNHIPIRYANGAMVYVRDVGFVHDGFSPQTNLVRRDGRHSALLPILSNGSASTLTVVDQARTLMPKILAGLPSSLKVDFLFDQSVFVRAAITGVLHEGAIAGLLTALMILLFLRSWRSTVIVATSIPLSILTSVIVLKILNQSLNVMTLGGMALAVGILVDDAA